MTDKALGRPYDSSLDQPLPGMPPPDPDGNPLPDLANDIGATAPDADHEEVKWVRPRGRTETYEDLPEPGPAIALPPPTDPMAVARAILQRAHAQGVPPYRYWRGEYYHHTGTHWATTEPTTITKWLYHVTENAYYVKTIKDIEQARDWAPDRKKIGNLTHALTEGLLSYHGEEARGIALQDGMYNMKTDKTDPHHPGRFNLSVLPFAHNANAACPRWNAFLQSILPGDTQAQEFLAEWFGYVLSGDTGQQKMLSLVGPKRCGKGTIARILEALLGTGAVASPTLGQLGGRFGEEGLIGRKLAIMGDVRWTPHAASEATPVLLAITGEDSRDVERKNRQNWHGYLGTRFMMMSNDLPNFRDASGALAYRMMQIHFTQSFVGREDTTLTEDLLKELPGIFNWAIHGLHALNRRGYFQPPASSEAISAEVRRMASPYQAFIEDFCEIDETAETAVPELLRGYDQWARREGRGKDQQTTASLSRGLRTTERLIQVAGRRTLPNGQKVTVLSGIKLAVAPAWLAADGATEHELLAGPMYEQPPLPEEPSDYE